MIKLKKIAKIEAKAEKKAVKKAKKKKKNPTQKLIAPIFRPRLHFRPNSIAAQYIGYRPRLRPSARLHSRSLVSS